MKPEEALLKRDEIMHADCILFPPHALVNLMIHAFHKPVFPSPSTYHLGYDKIQMIRAFQIRYPLSTPQTLIYANTESNIRHIMDQMNFPFVAKEVRNSQGRGVFLIRDRKDFLEYAAKNETLLAQEYLDIRKDLRVVWVADRVILAYWKIAPPGGFLNNVAAGGEIRYENIPTGAIDLVANVCRTLRINYAGFDVAEYNGQYFLLEFNLFFGTQALSEKKIELGPIIYKYLTPQQPDTREPLLPPSV